MDIERKGGSEMVCPVFMQRTPQKSILSLANNTTDFAWQFRYNPTIKIERW
jgi:hypothetical protein